MSLDYINEAFRSLELLTEDVFRADSEGINELSDFMSSDVDNEDKISIIDMDAETEDDLQDSYVGKVIVDCNICHSHIFRDKADITIDAEGIADINEECPYCGENNGFVIIGEIHEFKPEGEEEVAEETAEEEFADEQPAAEEVEEEEILDESLSESTIHISRAEMAKLDQEVEEATKEVAKYNISMKAQKNSAGDIERVPDFEAIPEAQREAAKKAYDRYSKAIAARPDRAKNRIIYDESLSESLTLWDELVKSYPELEAKNESLEESFKNVSIETEDQLMTMTSEDNGKVTVTTEPTANESAEGEVITPISDETESDIIAANAEVIDEEPTEEAPSEDSLDVDFEEVDEDSMSQIGESYLKKVYENVDSFKLTSCSTTASQLILEGLITFKSGVKKNTGFIFEAKDATRDGKLRFIGENAHLCRGRKAFTLVGSMSDKKLMCESLTYNYRAKDAQGKSTRVYGKVTRSK